MEPEVEDENRAQSIKKASSDPPGNVPDKALS